MGLGGPNDWGNWIPAFLNRSNHTSPAPPIDYFSLHGYATCANRTDPSTYSAGFFGYFRNYIQSIKDQVLVMRGASSFPSVKIDLDELGVIMPDDNNPGFGINASLPDIYWNAAGAAYAHVFATLTPLGVEEGISQSNPYVSPPSDPKPKFSMWWFP